MSDLVLSLFPGIGLLDMAFEEEGFCVVRGPDCLWGGDIRRFHPPTGRFGGVIGGPPCQAFSSLAHLVRASGHEPKFGNLIPEYERCVFEAQPGWFLMEEVRGAPVPVVPGYAVHSFLWCNSWVSGADGYGQEQMRMRRISFGLRGVRAVDLRRWMQPCALLLPDAEVSGAVCGGDKGAAPPPGMGGRVRREALTGGGDKPPSVRGGEGKNSRSRAVFGDGCPTRREARYPAVTGSDGGSGGMKPMRRYGLADALHLQGLPPDFLADAPFTAAGKLKAVANGVPTALGRAIARAVREAVAG